MRDINWYSIVAVLIGSVAVVEAAWLDGSIQAVTALSGLAIVNAILALKVD